MKKLLLAIGVLSLVAAGCNYQSMTTDNNLIQNSSSNTTESDNSTPPDISGWKTYTNTKLGFEFKYPSDYVIQDNPTDLPRPEDDPDAYKNTVVYLSNADSPNKEKGQIYIQLNKTSLRAQADKQFGWFLREMNFVTGTEDPNFQTHYYKYSYFTGDAYAQNHHYVLSDVEQQGPDDDARAIGNVLVIKVFEWTDGLAPETMTPDWIARTVKFTK